MTDDDRYRYRVKIRDVGQRIAGKLGWIHTTYPPNPIYVDRWGVVGSRWVATSVFPGRITVQRGDETLVLHWQTSMSLTNFNEIPSPGDASYLPEWPHLTAWMDGHGENSDIRWLYLVNDVLDGLLVDALRSSLDEYSRRIGDLMEYTLRERPEWLRDYLAHGAR